VKRPIFRIYAILAGVYLVYLGATFLLADYIFPPAQQSIFFQNDVLSGKLEIGTPKVLIIGDSTAAFGYTAGSLPNTLSMAVFSGSFAEMYYTLERYLKKLPAPNCIVMTASYNWAYHRDNRFWDIYALNRFYGLRELSEIYDASRDVGDFPASEYGKATFYLKYLLYVLRLQGLHMTDVQDAIFKRVLYRSNWKFHRLMRENMGSINKSSQIYPFIWEPHSHLNEPFAPAPLYDEYLRRIVALAGARGIRVNWIQSPISAQVLTPAAKEFYAALNARMRPLVMADPRNTYDGEIKVYPDELMFSATHLNIKGAHRFTAGQRGVFEGCQ
jgi:hypothetical protein